MAEEKEKIRTQLERRIRLTSTCIEEKLIPPVYRAPLAVQMELTHRCNLRCVMCYNRSGPSPAGYEELSDEEWLAQARRLPALGVCDVVISGGEPFLRKDLVFKLLDLCKEHGLSPHLITNGWLVTPAVAARLAQYDYGFIQVSIDGHSRKIHDRIRQVPGSWDRATRALQMLSSHGLICRMASTIVKENYRYVPETIELAVLLGSKSIIFGRVLAQGRGCDNSDDIAMGQDEAAEFYRLFNRERALKSHYIGVSLGMETHQQIIQSHISPNRAIILRPNGDVRLGCLAPFSYGNVRTQSLQEIWDQGANRGYLHPEVLDYIRNVLTEGEAQAVRRLGLDSVAENRHLSFQPSSNGAL
ncbi:MAG: radical SAM/SPASM domain-containing protein [Thermoanaerobaculia bacterium]